MAQQPPAPPPPSSESGRTAIEVTTGFFFLAFLLYFFKPTIVLDGSPNRVSWGTHLFEVGPGRHQVEIYFKYLFMDAGKSSIEVDVPAGQVRRIKYRAPWLVFLPGKIREV